MRSFYLSEYPFRISCRKLLICVLNLIIPFSILNAQQRADTTFRLHIENPRYVTGSGPVVMIDEAHNNMHRMEGRYSPFANLLKQDGYIVKPFTSRFNLDSLRACHILVISNAMPEWDGLSYNYLPTFSAEEIKELNLWIQEGGSLLLIADHKPFPWAINDLAMVFGIIPHNGYTFDSRLRGQGGYIFKQEDGSLRPHSILNGPTGKVDSVYTGLGSAFWAPEFEPLLVFGNTVRSRVPKIEWEFPPGTPSIPVEGWLQGAVRKIGKGRIAMFSEAGMFTAQIIDGGAFMGLNEAYGKQNPQFIRNLISWLAETSGQVKK